jgi:drug/metabolite transporter (DMT)-like permease
MSTVEAARRADPPLAAYGALGLGALAMAISPIFVRLAEVGPFASAFWRVALALPVLWAWDLMERPARPQPILNLPLLLTGLAFSADLFFWHLAILGTTVANATFFATTAPVWVVLVSWLFLRQRIARSMVIGLVLALAGGATLLGESLNLAPERLAGDFYGVVTAVFFGLYFLTVQAARRTAGAARVTFVSTIVTASVLLVVALLSGEDLLPATWRGAAALAALALLSHAGGQGLLAFALGHLPATFSSLVILLEAVAAAGFGWLILSEPVSPIQALGGLVILAGIWIARPQAGGRGA